MLKIGHRGACGYAPENTLASFQKAIELGVDMIEFDVQICKSGEAVIIHDYEVDKTTNGKGLVRELSLQQLKNLDAGNGEKIPTLQETLELINTKTKVNIELKGEGTAKIVSDCINIFTQSKNYKKDDFVVSSFLWEELKKFHQLNPEIKTGILAKRRLKGIIKYSPRNILKKAKEINAYSVNISLDSISKTKVKRLQKNGFKVFVYTVNEISDIEHMKMAGVDGLFSNFPDRI